LVALRYVFEDKLRASAESLILRSSLVLGAISVWMLNALNFRPQSNAQYAALAKACCQQVREADSDLEDNDENDVNLIPIGYDAGLYFLADLVDNSINEVWHVPGAVSVKVDEHCLASMYGRATMAILEHDAGMQRVIAPKGTLTHQSRISNKRQKTTDIVFVRGEDHEEDKIDLQLGDRGVTIRPVAREAGRDIVEQEARLYLEPNEPEVEGPDAIVSRIWQQTPYDIFAVAPNGVRNQDPSHDVMTNHARSLVTWDTFKTTNFSGVFEKAQLRMVDDEFWTSTLFNRYFPPKGTPPKERGKLQNFPYTTYYVEWSKLMSQLTHDDAKVVRAGLLIEFRKLKWLPHGGSDRMWATKKVTGLNWTMYPKGSQHVASPQIAVNLKTWHREPITMGVRAVVAMEDDEEEGGEDDE
jgi:hypothetical protein